MTHPTNVPAKHGRRQPRLALCAVLLAAAGTLAGCAETVGSAALQPASVMVAGPGAPTSTQDQAPTGTCSGSSSGFVDDCGPSVRYSGP